MGLFAKKSSKADEYDAQAKEYERQAREEARKRDENEKRLKSGKSQDPHADRYMIREHESNRYVAAKTAETLREFAKHERRRWFAPPTK